MNKKYIIEDILPDGFLHSRIYEFHYVQQEKIFKVNFDFADLKEGGALVDCTITITDWLDFEVIEYHGNEIFNKFSDNNIPELDSIVNFTYENNVLILEDLCGIDAIYNFKFTNPKINITGEYDPD